MSDNGARGVIIKQSDYGEGHRMLSIFTEDMGIVKAVSYGAKKLKSRQAASSQVLSWGEFELYESGRDISTLKSVNVIDGFFPISEDIKKLSLCTYLFDITYAMLGEGNPDNRLLKILLNTLYALAYRDEPIMKIKSVYELKLMSVEGYEPNLGACGVCGSNQLCAVDLSKGAVVCSACASKDCVPLNEGVYRALNHIVRMPDKKMLSFTGNDVLFEMLGKISEGYLLTQADRRFDSLEYFKAILEC